MRLREQAAKLMPYGWQARERNVSSRRRRRFRRSHFRCHLSSSPCSNSQLTLQVRVDTVYRQLGPVRDAPLPGSTSFFQVRRESDSQADKEGRTKRKSPNFSMPWRNDDGG